MQTDCFPTALAEWPKVPIAELGEINPRYPIDKSQDYPFVEMASVGENFAGILKFDMRRTAGSGLARFKADDTLFAKITPCPENGKVAFVAAVPGPLDTGLGSTEFIVLSPRAVAEPRFLYHLVCSHAVRGRAIARMEGSTGRQRVPDSVFANRLMVPAPPRSEQAAIAQTLDAVDLTIEETRKVVRRAEASQDAALEDAFMNLDAATHRLGEFVAETRYGTSRAANDETRGKPVLRIPNVVEDRLVLDDLAYVDLPAEDIGRLRLRDGDLLLVRTNGNPSYVGRSAVFHAPDDRTWVYASYLIRVRLRRQLLPEFVNAYLGLERGRRELLQRVTTSAGNHNINANSVKLIRIPIPSHADQRKIAETASAFREYRAALRSKEEALRAFKRTLAHDLLTGSIRVGADMYAGPQVAT